MTIGIDEYASSIWPTLNNAIFDCRSLTTLLCERYSFERSYESLENNDATNQNIHRSFNTLRNTTTPNDSIIIFFAGHGNMNPQTHRGYWIPYDGTNDPSSWIDNSVIKNYIEDLDCKHVWLIIDACFSGSFLSKTRGYTGLKTYAELKEKKSRWVLTSGREEKVSDGEKRMHSPFCRNLLEFLYQNNNRFCCVSEIINYVKIVTKNLSRQVPQGSYITNIGHEEGELILELKREFYTTEVLSTIGMPISNKLKSNIAKYQESKSAIPTGKEVLFLKSNDDLYDYIITDLFRFDDNGNKRISFQNDTVYLATNIPFKIIQRFATFQGLTRYINKYYNNINQDKVIIHKAHEDIEHIESSLYAIGYANYLQNLLDANPNPSICLHCGKRITTNDSYLVEIDESGLINNIGNVHAECLQPCNRVIGHATYENPLSPNLKNFDYELWLELIETGQGIIKKIYSTPQLATIYNLFWFKKHYQNEGKYCIQLFFDNGETNYIKRGQMIERFTEIEIDNTIELINKFINYQETSYPPHCMLSLIHI